MTSLTSMFSMPAPMLPATSPVLMTPRLPTLTLRRFPMPPTWRARLAADVAAAVSVAAVASFEPCDDLQNVIERLKEYRRQEPAK
jgi:hypothetical protein